VAGGGDAPAVAAAVAADYEASGARGRLPFMTSGSRPEPKTGARGKLRQSRHAHA
jgi:hypothetical protein